MQIISDQMKSTADYAIKVAKERFKLELDFSEHSIDKLENILGQIYWGFSNHTKNESEDGLIFNTAVIWGSFLGEYMRSKWGGAWILKGSDPLILIKNIEFSPISLVYQKITNHPEYSIDSYISETKRVVNTSVISPQQSRYKPEPTSPPEKPIPIKKTEKPVAINKRLLFALAGIGGILFVVLAFIIGYKIFKPGGISAIGALDTPTNTVTNIPTQTILFTATPNATSTPFQTATLLPTYTPFRTVTPRPSNTPSMTYTQQIALTPSQTQTPLTPTRARTPFRSPTARFTPTDTHVPATEGVAPTAVPPTATQPPPPAILSCEINPSTVQAGIDTPITFIVHFSVPGYGFNVSGFNPQFPGQVGCSGSDGNGTAQCPGSSGLVNAKVDVTLTTPLGDCIASYSP